MSCFFVPPYILKHLALSVRASREQRAWAVAELESARDMRTRRCVLGPIAVATLVPAGARRRSVYDAGNALMLRGELRRGENDPAVKDGAVNRAFDYSGATFDFFAEVYERNSLDARGLRLDSTVHYGVDYANAFWNGTQMVYGDGDRELFGDFTKCIDIVGHEMTHGVTQFEANLEYEGETGALNESFSDVFGSLVKQWKQGVTAAKADWLIGDGIFIKPQKGSKAKRDAVRSMKEPGTAYDDPLIGRDPQPGHMSDFIVTTDDDGGVHLNSGIPNRAFYLAATSIAGRRGKWRATSGTSLCAIVCAAARSSATAPT